MWLGSECLESPPPYHILMVNNASGLIDYLGYKSTMGGQNPPNNRNIQCTDGIQNKIIMWPVLAKHGTSVWFYPYSSWNQYDQYPVGAVNQTKRWQWGSATSF